MQITSGGLNLESFSKGWVKGLVLPSYKNLMDVKTEERGEWFGLVKGHSMYQ